MMKQWIQTIHRANRAGAQWRQSSLQHREEESGLTLIECIVALVIIALTIGSVTPALVIAVATRVQSQKTEQAVQVAQAEIDTVRTLVERGNYDAASVPTSVPALSDDPLNALSIEDHPGPLAGSANVEPTTTAYAALAADKTRAVDVDGDGDADFGVQVYRTGGESDNNGIPVAFTMGVRVYDIRAIESPTAAGNLAVEEARVGTTGGEGERSRFPLTTVYTVIAKGDLDDSYCEYIRFLGEDPATNYASLGCS